MAMLGANISGVIVLLIEILINKKIPQFHWKSYACLNGLISGLIYNVGNGMSVIAINSIGYSLAYPILQCGKTTNTL